MTERKSRSIVVSIVEGDGPGDLGTLRLSDGFAEKTFCLYLPNVDLVVGTASDELEMMLRTALMSLRHEILSSSNGGEVCGGEKPQKE